MSDQSDQQWNTAYASTMAMASVLFGALGVSLSLLALTRSQAVGSLARLGRVDVDVPRVHYSDDQVFVEVRNPGEWREMRDFIRPDDPALTHAIMGALSGRRR